MKNILKLGSIAFLSALCIACNKEKKSEAANAKHKGYVIRGELKNAKNGIAILSYYDGIKKKRATLDSSKINGGKFEIKGKIDLPMQVSCTILPDSCTFNPCTLETIWWLENSEITITGDVNEAKDIFPDGFKLLPVVIKGSKIQAESEAYKERLASLREKQLPFLLAYNKVKGALIAARIAKKDKQTLAKLKAKAEKVHEPLDSFSEQSEAIKNNYIQANPQSFVTAEILSRSMSRMKPEKSEAVYNQLSDEIKSSLLGKSIKARIEKIKSGFPGQSAFAFAAMDINDTPISLADYRGKYVLLDFWASSCVYCREGNPHLIQLYKKYHDKGIEFIGVASDDRHPKAWHKAVEQDKIGIWKHVLDGMKRTAAGIDKTHSIGEHYGISTLPTQILINPEGVIIARYGSPGDPHEDLDKKLKKLFGV